MKKSLEGPSEYMIFTEDGEIVDVSMSMRFGSSFFCEEGAMICLFRLEKKEGEEKFSSIAIGVNGKTTLFGTLKEVAPTKKWARLMLMRDITIDRVAKLMGWDARKIRLDPSAL